MEEGEEVEANLNLTSLKFREGGGRRGIGG